MNDKEDFVTAYLQKHGYTNVLDAEFVDEFVDRFGPSVIAMSRGANKVPSLSRLLGKMHKRGILDRATVGINAYMGGAGWPKWVYDYSLAVASD